MVGDSNARPKNWVDSCVSGTGLGNPDPRLLRIHNASVNYCMPDINFVGSGLENQSTAAISCEVRVKCGCTIVAPFSWIFVSIGVIEGTHIRDMSASVDPDDRIIMTDGIRQLQIHDVGDVLDLICFKGDVDSYKDQAASCRNTKSGRAVVSKLQWPKGRALVREEFSHDGIKDRIKDYGYLHTGGSGNLLPWIIIKSWESVSIMIFHIGRG
jgi:hypothetical protein